MVIETQSRHLISSLPLVTKDRAYIQESTSWFDPVDSGSDDGEALLSQISIVEAMLHLGPVSKREIVQLFGDCVNLSRKLFSDVYNKVIYLMIFGSGV
ncbi:hypothetical protein JTB14_002142 [Gonioctena quinquepunctata]|nr:hypothetical protein JTB14_002142 [Gonioctena quinquepunctata]